MKVVVLQSNYLPWKGYFDLIKKADLFVFYDEVKFTKNDWRNRNQILGSNGLKWLTIPIDHKAYHQRIAEVKLPDNWQEAHARLLQLTYSKAPYYFQLESLIADTLLHQKWVYLKDLNHYLIEQIARLIGIQTVFVDSKLYHLKDGKIERLLDLLIQVGATTYLSGPQGRNYLQHAASSFKDAGIQITYYNYPEYPAYPQFSDTFYSNVSIVDMIAHLPYSEIKNYIWEFKS